jgi:hypothetical protein
MIEQNNYEVTAPFGMCGIALIMEKYLETLELP